MKIDAPLMENLVRLRNMPEFQAFRIYLDVRVAAHVEALVGLNEDRAMHVAQGMAREAKHLVELIEQSPALLDKARQR